MKIFYLGIFGGLGCITRYLISGWVYNLAGRSLPYGTLAVNVIGSLLPVSYTHLRAHET